MIDTWSEFLVTLTRLIDGDDVSISDVSNDSLTAIISLGERRIYREVRSRHNEKAFSAVTVASNLAAIPDDFESSSVLHFGGKALIPAAEEWLREYLDGGPTGDCRYFAEAGGSFQFGPAVADGTALQGRYFYRWPDLNATTLPSNTLFLKENDLFLYGCLAESAPFFGQDARVPMWDARYRSIKDRINKERERGAFSAGRIARTNSTPVLK